MKRQEFLKHRLQTLSALSDAVGVMRSLSAHQFRRVRRGLAAARTYRDEMNAMIGEIGVYQPLRAGLPAGLLIVASDLGLCGDYNSRLSQLAIAEARRLGVERVYSVGRRVRGTLRKSLPEPDRVYDAPASLEGLSRLLVGLAEDILEDYLELRIGSLQVVAAGFHGVGSFTPLTVRILPIEPVTATSPLRRSPYVDADYLTTVAVREFLFITLYEVLLEALAAEHGMLGLMAAETAQQWLERTSETTSRRLASARSEASTQELLDIVYGSRKRFRTPP